MDPVSAGIGLLGIGLSALTGRKDRKRQAKYQEEVKRKQAILDNINMENQKKESAQGTIQQRLVDFMREEAIMKRNEAASGFGNPLKGI